MLLPIGFLSLGATKAAAHQFDIGRIVIGHPMQTWRSRVLRTTAIKNVNHMFQKVDSYVEVNFAPVCCSDTAIFARMPFSSMAMG